MKKTRKVRLTLNRETLKTLEAPEIQTVVVGGIPRLTGTETESCPLSCLRCP